jgi:hypothetical protein
MLDSELERTETKQASLVSGTFHLQAYDLYPPGTVIDTPVYFNAPSYERYYERKSRDDVGSRVTWKSFEHYKRSCETAGTGFGRTAITADLGHSLQRLDKAECSGDFVAYSGRYGAPGYLNDGLQAFIDPLQVTGFVPAPAELSGLVAASLRAMLPRIRPELSSINSAIELKDFKSVKGTIKNIGKLPRLALRKARRFKNIYQMLQVAADVYLQYKFNIAPLVSDVHGIRRALERTERRIHDLVSRSGSPRVMHYAQHLVESDAPAFEQYPTLGGPIHWYDTSGVFHNTASYMLGDRFVQNTPALFHAQVQYNYLYTAYQLEHARVLALLDAFGINLNPAIIWNAIPWSFVVDWLVDVGQWLGNQRVGNMDPKTNILQYLWSIKRDRTIICGDKIYSPQLYGTSFPIYPPERITHPVVRETAYRRSAGLPSASWLTASGVNLQEFTLGAALVISRRRSRRHKT